MSNKNSAARPLQFTGTSEEFFKIWIVNIKLSILTLGIYSAWAKVRTRRYFYSNTLFMGSPFDYLAEPIKILKGRLIAFAIFVLFLIVSLISPALQAGIGVLFMPLFPLILIKTLSFNFYNTAYHGIRFNFKGQYLKAFYIFVGLPLFVALTLGIAYPYFTHERKKFMVSNMGYGTSLFEFKATTGQFYRIYLNALAIIIGLGIMIVPLIYKVMPKWWNTEDWGLFMFAMLLVYFLVLIIIFSYLYTRITNLVINQTELAGHRFSSQLQARKMMWITLTNLFAIMCSFGLLIPWALIRMARYRIESITVYVNGHLNDFIAAETQRVQAIGEEIGDIFDLEIDLGL
jgi:uncharacterized membrane protein YjgN (DUF898 family)